MPPKKKAKTVKKPSPAYLAELEKLKRIERKYVLGNQETAQFLLYPAEYDDSYEDKKECWLVKLVSSYENIPDMSMFEEMEEYWNDIPKVKQKLKDHDKDIVWEGNVFLRNVGSRKMENDLLEQQGPLVFTYSGGWSTNIDGPCCFITGLQKMLCEKLQIIDRHSLCLKELAFDEAKVPANTQLIRVFGDKTSTEQNEKNNFYKWKAYLDAGLAIKDCEYEITSGKEAIKLNGVGKSSAELVDKHFAEKAMAKKALGVAKKALGVAKKFFDVADNKGVRKAYASLPKDVEIELGTDGVLRVNGKGRDDFHARGCPFELEIGGKTWVVDGTMDTSPNWFGLNDPNGGVFEGTISHKKEVHSIHYQYNYHNSEPIDCSADFDEEEIGLLEEELNQNVIYEYNFGDCRGY